MKNLISYYYNLGVEEFKKRGENFDLQIENKIYEFVVFYGDINEFYKTYLILLKNNKYCHEVIFNKNKTLLTIYNNKPYILIKKNICINKQVDFDEIINYDTPIYIEKTLNWKKLWEMKIDFYEQQISQISFKYKTLKNSFDYYIGLSETAISLLNFVDKKSISYYIAHKRINCNESLDNFFNPINIIIDSRTRDIAEYIKTYFFNRNNDIDIEKILVFLDNLNFDYTESILFLSRLFYPSYFFDIYDQIIQENACEEKLNLYIKKNILYETLLKKIYKHLRNNKKIPLIEWLEI